MSLEFSNLSFDLPKNQSNAIKVIGVGGGGSNAINHMYNKGIKGVDFVVCNTDAQALQSSPVPYKIQLGATLTEGLGAGAGSSSWDGILLGSMPRFYFYSPAFGDGRSTVRVSRRAVEEERAGSLSC